MLLSLIEKILGRTLYDAPDSGSGGGADDNIDPPEDDADILADPDDDVEPEPEPEPDNGDPDEELRDEEDRLINKDGHLINEDGKLINEDGELVDENDEVIVDDEPDEELDRITHASDLKKAYPDIFKKFPDIKAALFRDQRYGEIFANPEEAELSVKQAGLLRQIEDDLINKGDPKELLSAIKKDNPDSYKKVVQAVFTETQAADKELYFELASLPIKQLLRRAFKDGGGKDGNLGKAALYVHKFFFDNYDLDAKVELEEATKKGAEGKSKKELELEERLKQIDQRDYSNFERGVSNSYVTRMKDVVLSGIKDDERLTDYIKNKIVEDTLIDIKGQLDRDPRYMKQIKSLWEQAKASGYSNDFKSRIVSTALARAKSLVANVRAQKVSEALGKNKKKDKDGKVVEMKRKEDKPTQRRDKQPDRKPEQKKSSNPDLDILRNG